MARAVLVWFDGEHLRLADVQSGRTSTIGRAPGSTVDLSDSSTYDRFKTVSRQHAAVRGTEAGFFLQHLSRVNPSRVNGALVAMDQPKHLADGDVIELGGALRLTFHSGSLRGDGHDWVGAFTIDGHYELQDGRCWWTKRYVGQHEVSYTGYNEGKGIWGIWEIPPWSRGGFHIWPVGMADPTQATLEAEERVPGEIVAGRVEATLGPTPPAR